MKQDAAKITPVQNPGAGTANFLIAVLIALFPGFLVGGGFYNPVGASARASVAVSLSFLAASFFALMFLLLFPAKVEAFFSRYPSRRFIETALLISVGLCASDAPLPRASVAILAALLILVPDNVRGKNIANARFYLLFAIGAGLAAWPLIIHPHPTIDVFHVLERGGRLLASGHNPYAHPIPIAGETAPSLFTYFPGALLFILPGALMGDPRVMTLMGSLGAAATLHLLLRKEHPDAARMIPLFLILNPALLYVVDNAWLEPAFLFFGALSLAFFARDRRLPAGLALAGFVSVKQLLLPFLIFFARSGPKGLRAALWAAGTAIVLCLPFLLWAPKPFLENTFLFYILPGAVKGHVPPLHLSQTLNTLYYAVAGRDIPGAVRWGSAGGIFVIALWRQPKGIFGALLAGTVFLLGLGILSTFAFMNYYYMIQGLLVLCAAAALIEKSE